MRKQSLIFILLACFINTFAQQTDGFRKKAENFLGTADLKQYEKSNVSRKKSISKNTSEFKEITSYAIYNSLKSDAYVIIGSEYENYPILAYSFSGIIDDDSMAPQLRVLLQNYNERIVCDIQNDENLLTNKESEEELAEPIPVVEPLCKSSWGQSAPYNSLCPAVGKQTCPTGCVATAMGQIMYYWRWPSVGKGKVYYTPQSGNGIPMQAVDFSKSNYMWDEMRNTTSELKENQTSADAVAKLLYDCGVATRMMYAPDGSGTYDDFAMQALYENFSYRASTLRVVHHEACNDDNEWLSIIENELKNGRPVMFAGADKDGDNGHEYVVDGYDSNDFLHVNFGWNGKSDGYYSTNIMKPSANSDFSYGQSVVIGIEPDYAGDDKKRSQVKAYMSDGMFISGTIELGTPKSVTIPRLLNVTRAAHTWTYGVGLFDSNDEMISNVIVDEVSATVNSLAYGPTKYVKICIPANCSDGDYYLSAIFMHSGFDNWELPEVKGGSLLNKIPVKIKDGVVSYGEEVLSITSIQGKVVSKEYFTLSGVKLVTPANQDMVIERSKYSDGSVKTRKVFK